MTLPRDACQKDRSGTSSLAWVGFLLIVSGFVHACVWAGAAWAGAFWDADPPAASPHVSWRKPVLFGFSVGATSLSLAWLLTKLTRRRWDIAIANLCASVLLIEVLLISLQQWRGVESHFNRDTAWDAGVSTAIEVLAVIATCCIGYLTWRSFGQLPVTRDMVLAIRHGMSYLFLACLLGIVIVAVGYWQQHNGQSPHRFGAAGVPKFPHGVPIHAIQALPLLAWIAAKAKMDLAGRVFAVRLASYSTAAFTAYSMMQTMMGRARFDVTAGSMLILSIATALLLAVALTIAGPIARLVLSSRHATNHKRPTPTTKSSRWTETR